MPDSPATFTAGVVQELERHRAQLAVANEQAARVVELARRTLSAGAPHDLARRLAESILRAYDADARRPERANVVVRDARPEDADALIALLGYIEGFDDEGARIVREGLEARPCPQHAADVTALVAVDDADGPIGVLMCGAPVWMLDGSDAPPHWRELMRRIAQISAVAVDPEHRRRGVGRALVERAEHEFRTSGRRLVTLLHAPDIAPFYDALGYTVQSHFVAFLGDVLYREDFHDMRLAFKPLDPRARQTTVLGLPVPMITGILEDVAPPRAHWWFDGERLRH